MEGGVILCGRNRSGCGGISGCWRFGAGSMRSMTVWCRSRRRRAKRRGGGGGRGPDTELDAGHRGGRPPDAGAEGVPGGGGARAVANRKAPGLKARLNRPRAFGNSGAVHCGVCSRCLCLVAARSLRSRRGDAVTATRFLGAGLTKDLECLGHDEPGLVERDVVVAGRGDDVVAVGFECGELVL